jgi:SAM-dependent methyltransferase
MTEAELRELDALLESRGSAWWDGFYSDRAKPCPFFVTAPDESLATWTQAGTIRPGRAIDLGCGHGRNAIFLARLGFAVEAVDSSRTAIDWARERIAEANVPVALLQRSVFALDLAPGAYDLVYDSGCFHHIPPHRRAQYVEIVVNALKPGGFFGLTCFRPEGGSGRAGVRTSFARRRTGLHRGAPATDLVRRARGSRGAPDGAARRRERLVRGGFPVGAAGAKEMSEGVRGRSRTWLSARR